MLNAKFKQADKNLFLLKYENNYGLDELLEKGVSNIGELATFVQKYFKAGKGDVKFNGGGFACTTFNSVTAEGDYTLARNFDYKDAPCIVVWTAPENDYKSVAVTTTNVMLYGGKLGEKENKNRLLMAPYACMDGINEKGLSIAVLELKDKAVKQQTGKTPITTTVIIRAVLDKCATVEEAVEMFKRFDMHDSLFCAYHYQVTDANGKSAVIEYINNELTVEIVENDRQYLLNFYHTPNVPLEKAFGFTRERWLNEEFARTGFTMSEDQSMKLLEKCKLYYRHKRGYMITSLWSAVYNCSKKTVQLCVGMDYKKKYYFGVDCKEFDD